MTLREEALTIKENAESFMRSLDAGRDMDRNDLKAVLYLVSRLASILAAAAPVEH